MTKMIARPTKLSALLDGQCALSVAESMPFLAVPSLAQRATGKSCERSVRPAIVVTQDIADAGPRG